MKKILIVRFSSIGDIILTTPVIRCIKQQLNAEVHFLTKEQFKGILISNPCVDQVITIKSKVSEAKDRLLSEQYDHVIDLHHNLRSAQVKRLLKKPSSSFPKLNLKKWLLVNAHIDLMPPVHIVDRYFEPAAAIGVKNDGEGLDYFIAEGNEFDISSLPAEFRNGYTALTVGAKFATKQLPVDKIISIIRKTKRHVVLLGGKDDMQRAAMIREACGERVADLTGKLNLDQSASVIRQAELVIAHDTGLMHIAAAFRKKIFSVWGNTVPALGMYPYLPGDGSKIIEVKGLSCRPCSKIGYSKCPKGHFKCMNLINEEEFTA